MSDVPVEIKKSAPAPTSARLPDTWRSFRQEMDRLFDRFSGVGLPGFRRWFDAGPTWTDESSFSFPVPAADVTEGEKDFKVTVELPGLVTEGH